MGYRLVDCAPVYDNEKVVGEGLKSFLQQVRVTGTLQSQWAGSCKLCSASCELAHVAFLSPFCKYPAKCLHTLQGRRHELVIVSKVWNDAHRPAELRC